MEKLDDINNRLTTVEESFFVVLDSRNATNNNNGSFNSDVTFNFKESILKPPNCIQMSCSVLQFTAPNSIYNVNETNNRFVYSEQTNNSGVKFNVDIPFGNYNIRTFINQFKKSISFFSNNFDLTFNNINNKLTLLNISQDFTIYPESTIYNVMGFDKGSFFGSSPTGLSTYTNQLIMPYSCNFNGIQSINIVMPCINTRNIDSYNKSKSSIIQPIQVDATQPQIAYTKSDSYAFNIYQYKIDYIQIRICDDLENEINFNNQHWNLTLVFNTLIDKERFHFENTFESILKYGYNQNQELDY